MAGPLGGPLPPPFAVMLLLPYEEMRPPPDGFNPVVLLVIWTREIRTVAPAWTVIPCPLFALMQSFGLVDTYLGIILPQIASPRVRVWYAGDPATKRCEGSLLFPSTD